MNTSTLTADQRRISPSERVSSGRALQSGQGDDRNQEEGQIRDQSQDQRHGNVRNARRIALTRDGMGGFEMESHVHPLPVVFNRRTLEEVVARRPEKPQHVVGDVDPPEDPQPSLVYEKDPSVEKQERQLDREERRTVEDGINPLILSNGQLS